MTSSTVCCACRARANASMITKMSARPLSPFTFLPFTFRFSPRPSPPTCQPPLPRQLAARRVLAIELCQLRVHRRIGPAHDVGGLEERLAPHPEEFSRRFRRLRIAVGILAGLHAT